MKLLKNPVERGVNEGIDGIVLYKNLRGTFCAKIRTVEATEQANNTWFKSSLSKYFVLRYLVLLARTESQ